MTFANPTFGTWARDRRLPGIEYISTASVGDVVYVLRVRKRSHQRAYTVFCGSQLVGFVTRLYKARELAQNAASLRLSGVDPGRFCNA